jgi:hypothetical protein
LGESTNVLDTSLPTQITPLPVLLNQKRTALKKIAQIKEKGLCLFDCWLECKIQEKSYAYHRLRTKHGMLPNGSKTMYVRKKEVANYKKAIARGREIRKLERLVKSIEQRANCMIKRAQLRGLVVRNPLGDVDSPVEWYTPPIYIEMARQVLGNIDLDPASNHIAQEWIQAKVYYTKEDDGLIQPWFGSVWLNPPYGSPEVRLMAEKFLEKAIAQYHVGSIDAAILLLNRTGAAWYKKLVQQATVLCEVANRICFIDHNCVPQRSPRYYNDFIYLGKVPEKFIEVFGGIGSVTKIDAKRI